MRTTPLAPITGHSNCWKSITDPTHCPERAGRTWRILLQFHPETPIQLMISHQWIRLPAVLLAACLSLAPATAQVLTNLKQCELVATEWSDGDSSQIQTLEGQTHTIAIRRIGLQAGARRHG